MIRVYHRPGALDLRALLILATASLLLVALVEALPVRRESASFERKLAASRKAEAASALLDAERARRELPRPPEDTLGTGLLGPKGTSIATSTGTASAKLTATNPNFAALVVEYLEDLGAKRGDVVAVGYSGSFPGLNVAVLAATETLGLETLAITSAAGSDFGATWPEFSWLDMERFLAERNVFRTRSIGASLGGIEDQAIGMSAEGKSALLRAIEEGGTPAILPTEFEESLDRRMKLYEERAAGRPIVAYVNVGGGAVSVGHSRGKSTYDSGINRPGEKPFVDSVIGRFLERGVPVVHLVRVTALAREVGLPAPPRTKPRAGEGALFSEEAPNRLLALAGLGLLSALIAALRKRAQEDAAPH